MRYARIVDMKNLLSEKISLPLIVLIFLVIFPIFAFYLGYKFSPNDSLPPLPTTYPSIQPLPTEPIYPTVWERDCRPRGSCAQDETSCPEGTVCSGLPAHKCYPPNCPMPICLSSNVTVSAPDGEKTIREIKLGSLVWSLDAKGQKIIASVIRVVKTPVSPSHKVVHITLEDGREVSASPGHPTIDGKTIDLLKVGETLDASMVAKIEILAYDDDFTFDLLPTGDTGFYFANGIPLKSSLK